MFATDNSLLPFHCIAILMPSSFSAQSNASCTPTLHPYFSYLLSFCNLFFYLFFLCSSSPQHQPPLYLPMPFPAQLCERRKVVRAACTCDHPSNPLAVPQSRQVAAAAHVHHFMTHTRTSSPTWPAYGPVVKLRASNLTSPAAPHAYLPVPPVIAIVATNGFVTPNSVSVLPSS